MISIGTERDIKPEVAVTKTVAATSPELSVVIVCPSASSVAVTGATLAPKPGLTTKLAI
jgi:hypothetical protein